MVVGGCFLKPINYKPEWGALRLIAVRARLSWAYSVCDNAQGKLQFFVSVCQGFHWPVCDRTRKMPIKGLDIWGAVISYFQPCWLVQQQCVRLPGKTLAVVETKQKYCIWVRFGYLITCYFIFLFRYSSKRAYLLTTKTPVTIRSTVKIEIMSTSLVNVGQDAVKPKGVYQLQVINSVNLNILFKLPFYSTFIA